MGILTTFLKSCIDEILSTLRIFYSSEKERDRLKRDDSRPNETAPVNPATTKTGKGLSESQRDRFEDMLRNLLPDRNPIAETMVRFFIKIF
jgi:hypothetical protein